MKHMPILQEYVGTDIPMSWMDVVAFANSDAIRVEVYSEQEGNTVQLLKDIFYSLFDAVKDEIIVFDRLWWDFCLDVWSIQDDTYNYGLEGKSFETQVYLTMLMESNIKVNYTGGCIVNDWEQFLSVILPCIAYHIAPYSPLLCSAKSEFFFYFHHTDSIGLYYRERNSVVDAILRTAEGKYSVVYR